MCCSARYPSCAVLAWAAKRWSRARLLKIGIKQDNMKELSQALACAETAKLARLEEVRRWYVLRLLYVVDDLLMYVNMADFGLLSASCMCTPSIAATRRVRLPAYNSSHEPAIYR